MLPPLSFWTGNVRLEHLPKVFGVPLKQLTSQSVCDMKSGDLVYKYGAAGFTPGTFQRYEPKCWTKHDKSMKMGPSGEHMFIAHRKPREFGKIPSFGDTGTLDRSSSTGRDMPWGWRLLDKRLVMRMARVMSS